MSSYFSSQDMSDRQSLGNVEVWTRQYSVTHLETSAAHESIPNRTLSSAETRIYLRRKSLETEPRRQRIRFVEQEQKSEISHSTSHWKQGQSAVKNKIERNSGTVRTTVHHCSVKVYQYLQQKLGLTDSSIKELGSATTDILIWCVMEFIFSPFHATSLDAMKVV